MNALNGIVQELPFIKVAWDSHLQNVGVSFDRDVFKNPMFVVAVLDMAKQAVEGMIREAQARAIQQQMAQQVQEAQLIRKLGIN